MYDAIRYSENKDYNRSNDILIKLSSLTSHSQPYLLIGQNYEELCKKDSAEKYYYKALNRIPNRLRPNYLLMKLYKKYPDDSIKYINQVKILLNKVPKVSTIEIMEMKDEAFKELYGVELPINKGHKDEH